MSPMLGSIQQIQWMHQIFWMSSDPAGAGQRRARRIRRHPGVLPSLASWHVRERAALAALAAVLLGSLVFYMHSAFGHGDVTLYHRYAQYFWLGSPPQIGRASCRERV